jgi:predicted carbohydrate-binding protein with CBM5 and CBM33 domain
MIVAKSQRALGITVVGLASLVGSGADLGRGPVARFHRESPKPTGILRQRNRDRLRTDPVGAAKCGGTWRLPQAGPTDGKLCSGGNTHSAQLDDQRGGTWPLTDVKAGEVFPFRWKTTASHSTESYRYFITKNGWDPTKPLTRDQLEPAPFLAVDYGGKKPGPVEIHEGQLPVGKTGKHVIYAVWEIADTNNAFYACSDVHFG